MRPKNKSPMFERNTAVSEFIPSVPVENPALQNAEIPNTKYDGVTIQDMRDNPELFDHTFDSLDKSTIVTESLRREMPKVKETAKALKDLKNKSTRR